MRKLLTVMVIFFLALLSCSSPSAPAGNVSSKAALTEPDSLYRYRALFPDVQPFLSSTAALAMLRKNLDVLERIEWAEFEYLNTRQPDAYGQTKQGGYQVQPITSKRQTFSAFGAPPDLQDPASKQLLEALVSCHLQGVLFYNTANSGIYVFHVSSGLGNSPVVLTHEVPTVPIGQGTDVLFVKSYDPKLDFKALGGTHKGDSWWQLPATTPIEKVLDAVRVQD